MEIRDIDFGWHRHSCTRCLAWYECRCWYPSKSVDEEPHGCTSHDPEDTEKE